MNWMIVRDDHRVYAKKIYNIHGYHVEYYGRHASSIRDILRMLEQEISKYDWREMIVSKFAQLMKEHPNSFHHMRQIIFIIDETLISNNTVNFIMLMSAESKISDEFHDIHFKGITIDLSSQ